MDRYVTQIFFPGEPLNETDLLLNGVPDRATRDRITFEFTDAKMGDLSYIGYRRDFILRGHKRTPEVD
jgi:protocatechuate 3,4-dioxygenase beta subunit